MQNYVDWSDVPIGFRMTLMQNIKAMSYFISLPAYEQQSIIEQTRRIRSKNEMSLFVQALLK